MFDCVLNQDGCGDDDDHNNSKQAEVSVGTYPKTSRRSGQLLNFLVLT